MSELLSDLPSDPSPRDSFEIARPFLERYAEAHDVFVIGGLGSAALSHPDMRISERDRTISVPDLTLPSVRVDGTKRDIDVLVATTDDRRTLEVEWTLADAVRDELGTSVCNFADGQHVIEDLGHPFDRRVFLSGFVSNRYTDPFTDNKESIVRYIFPFIAPLDTAHFEPWRIEVKESGLSIPVPPPAATLSNYLVRSTIGLRPADTEKIWRSAPNVFTQSPEQREWLIDGPGKNQVELSAVLQSLHRRGRDKVEILPSTERKLYSHHELTQHEFFAANQLSYLERRAVLIGSLGKSVATMFIETHPQLKALFRQYAEEAVVRLADRRHDHVQ